MIVKHQNKTITSLIESIKAIQNDINESNSRSDISLVKIQKGRERLFDSLFVYENYPNPYNEEQQSRIKIRFTGAVEKLDYPLAVIAYEVNNQLIFKIKYAGELFSNDGIEQLLLIAKNLLEQIVINPYQKVQNLSYLDQEQYQQIINNWNDTDKAYPSDKTIQALFEEQVARTPDNVAVVYEETKLAYRQLNERANQLANYLRDTYEIKPDTLIALCLDRSEHMVIAILGILKAGGAYVPMDPSYPDERISYILEDTSSKLVLTNKEHKQRLESLAISITSQITILAIDDQQAQALLASHLASNPVIFTTSNNLAYVIYTSGTTGNPKGVMIEHRGIINLTIIQEKDLKLPKEKNIKNCLCYANYVFDAHVWEVYTTILNGHILYIIDNNIRQDIGLLNIYIQKNDIDIALLPPMLLNHEYILKLNILVVGGDKTNKEVLNYYQNSNVKVINAYGPSEVTVCTSLNHYNNNGDRNIGSAISNVRCYVLDSNLAPLPIGAIGELYIGGVGLARGYLNRPDLTAEKFIANPFQNTEEKKLAKNARLYKTGDMVRWLPDGNLEYIGRNDSQVKIRGYRIELEEIETVLSSYEGIKQSVVLAKEQQGIGESGSKYLAGYYVSEYKLDEEAIFNYLQTRLPEYMVPTVLTHLERLPLTINGKLDRKSLPDPEFTNVETYVAPRNELESQVCRIWAEVLGLPEDKVGVGDDFFRLGGNSILVIKLVSKLNTYYHSYIRISDIFIFKNIDSLIPRIIQTNNNYQTIIKLNNTYTKPNMFMIHPGRGGCEVYTSLANTLINDFSCYGIDSYNLYNKNKIDNLHELATYYLKYIEETMIKTHQSIYNLLGWSLGGQIALEIASILEQKGKNKIKVYLLDTLICDDYLLTLINNMDIAKLKDEHRKYMITQKMDTIYIEKAISNINIENKLMKQQISSILTTTHILLFKAMLEDIRFKTGDSWKFYVSTLEYNNIDKVIENQANIKLIKVNNAHHGNILEQELLLLFAILCGTDDQKWENVDQRWTN